MTRRGLVARFARLEQLSIGLARELGIVRKRNDPLLRGERQAYLAAIADALSGVERARVARPRQPSD